MNTTVETTCPKLCDGLVALPTAAGLLFAGGPRRHLLTGAAAGSVVPRMLPLLDGRHTIAEVASAAGLTVPQARAAVSLLDRCDLLEEGAAGPAGLTPPGRSAATAALSRHVNVTRVHPNGAAIAAVLADSAVSLVAPERLAAPVAEDLRAAGVGQVVWASRPDATAVTLTRHSLVVLHDQPEAGHGADIERNCRERGVPMLRFAARPDRVEIGPVFYRGYTACYTCFRDGYTSLGHDRPVLAGEDTGTAGEPGTVTAGGADWLAAGLVTAEILAILGQLTSPRSFRAMTVVAVPGLESDRLLATPAGDCPVCGFGDPAAGDYGEMADAYEWLVQNPPPELWPTADANQRRPGFLSLQAQRPDFPASPGHPLPAPGAVPMGGLSFGTPAPAAGGFPAAGGALDESVIAGILLRVAGLRPPGDDQRPPRRWAPTGGNLASVELYLLAGPRAGAGAERGGGQSSVFGQLPGSVFRYDDIGHRLQAIRRSAVPLAECLAGTGLTAPPVRLAVVLVAAVERISQKYGAFSYRLAHLDAGCAAAQLTAVCTGYGLGVSFARTWDERLTSMLDLYAGSEVITAVAGIHLPEGSSCH